MKKKILIIIIIISIIGGGLYYFFGRSSAEQSSANVVNVELQELIPSEITTKVSADGNIKTKNEKNIKIKINGLVKDIFVEEGVQISKNDKIIQLDDEKFQKALQNAKLNLRETENNYQDLKATYETQKRLNNLKIIEANKNLEIAILSKNTEQQNLENKKYELEEQILETKTELNNLESKLSDQRYLYNNGAIPEVELIQLTENYEKVKQKYISLQHKLEIHNNKTIPNTIKLAELKVENAKNNLELLKTNIKNEEISKNDLEAAHIKVIKAEQEITNIKEDINKLLVTTPISGMVVNFELKSGDKISEGTTVAKVADVDNLIAEIMVDEININDVEIGQKVFITSDSFQQELEGKIVYTAPVSTKVGNINKYKTKVEIMDNRGVIKPGMFVNAEITTNHKEDVLTVPSIAVIGEDNKYVYVENDGKAVKKEVTVGLKSLNKVEIQGLKEGEKVIVGPFTTFKTLTDGTLIKENSTTISKGNTK